MTTDTDPRAADAVRAYADPRVSQAMALVRALGYASTSEHVLDAERELYEYLAAEFAKVPSAPVEAVPQMKCPHCVDGKMVSGPMWRCPECGGTGVDRDQVRENAKIKAATTPPQAEPSKDQS